MMLSRNHFFGVLLVAAIGGGLSACALVGYDRGLELSEVGGNDTGYRSEYLRIAQPPLVLEIKGNPPEALLAVSPPILPLPVFPWIPGIWNFIFHRQRYMLQKENLKIDLAFSRYYVDRVPQSTEFIFSPNDAKLISGDKAFYPEDVTVLCGEKSDNECRRMADGRYSIVVNSSAMPSCILTYKFFATDITKAHLQIDNLVFNGTPTRADIAILAGRTYRMEYVGP